MKIKKISSKKKNILLVSAIVIVVLVLTAGVLYVLKNKSSENTTTTRDLNSIDYKEPTSEQVDAGNKIKQNTADENTKNNTSDSGSTSSAPTSILITAANSTTSKLQLRIQISPLQSEGTCTLTLTKAGATIKTYSAGIQPLAETATCMGFDIDTSSFEKGTWLAEVKFSGPNSTLASVSKDVEVK